MDMSKTTTGLVFVFGSGDCGQLGLGEDVLSRKKPTQLSFFNDKEIISTAAGGLHNLALSKNGTVYSWGCNDEKALGHNEPEWTIGTVDSLIHEKIIQIACGDSISAALTEKGQVYTWGTYRDSKGIMGFSENTVVQDRPTLLDSLTDYKIISIAAGSNHLVALTSDRQLFSWGSGEQGQLGRRILERHKLKGLRPQNVTPRKKRSQTNNICYVACGAYHTLALSDDHKVFSWGLNNFGQLGHNDTNERLLPEEIILDDWNIPITALAAGEHHSIALAQNGTVWGWGRGDSGQLCSSQLQYSPRPVQLQGFPNNKRITGISSGSNHCLAVDNDSNIYSWGFGGMYQLGNGKDEDLSLPFKIDFPHGKVLAISGGGQHSVLLCQK